MSRLSKMTPGAPRPIRWAVAALIGSCLATGALAAPPERATPPPLPNDGPILDLDGDDRDAPDHDPGALAEPDEPAGDAASDDTTRPPSHHDAHRQAVNGRTDLLTDLAEKTSHLSRSTTLGGYGEVEFVAEQDSDSSFVAHRYVLFVYAQLSDRISTSTELELEFGGSPSKRDGVQQAGEALLEFSVVDFRLTDWMTLRGGIILVPFGAFNIRHDAPTRDLTERPNPLTTITPTTWFEAGVGLLGDIPLGGDMSLNYELYVINGLDAKISRERGMKGAIGSKLQDNNGDKAVVGRVAFSPFLGAELGLSGYTGAYDDAQHRVNMLGGDLSLRLGRFELLAEYVHAFVDPGFVEGFSAQSPANTRAALPREMQGFYVQTNVHFQIPGLWDLLPDDLRRSELTAVLRYELTDTDMALVDRFDLQKLTLGLNYRPIEAYVVKTELQLQSRSVDGIPTHLFSGNFDPTWRFVSSLAWLF